MKEEDVNRIMSLAKLAFEDGKKGKESGRKFKDCISCHRLESFLSKKREPREEKSEKISLGKFEISLNATGTVTAKAILIADGVDCSSTEKIRKLIEEKKIVLWSSQ